MDNLIYYTGLSWNKFIGPKRYSKIRNAFDSLSEFFILSPEEQLGFLGIKQEDALNIFKNMMANGERILSFCRKNSIMLLTMEDPAYPPRLKEIPDPPFLLYKLGDLNYSMHMVAVVGTRDPTPEAKTVNEFFVKEMVSYNIGIVSGLAMGHDAIAQKTVIDFGGYTIAVLGCGVDRAYPAQMKDLYNSIKINGAIISEYPPGSIPLKGNFPLRNRIISGLSDAVLVIQAPERSGALITAKYAEVQGRELYSIPGNPSDLHNTGSNHLIRNGAKIACHPEDIIFDVLGGKARKISATSIDSSPSYSQDEKKVLESIEVETCIDEIAGLTGISVQNLYHILTTLEIRGIVTQYPGNFYVKNKTIC